MIRTLILSLLLTALVPVASAECIDSVCVDTHDNGDGCTSGAEWDDTSTGAVVTTGASVIYVTNGCYVYNAEGYSEEGSYLQAGFYSYDENTGYQAGGVSWYGYTWTGGSWCAYSAYTYGLSPIPDGGENVDCVNGPPGHVLP